MAHALISSDDNDSVEFEDLPSEEEVVIRDRSRVREAVLHATDWTTETIVSQLKRGNIILDPSFQRRDAWQIVQKSRFIESLILNLPIPQLVLAESIDRRGRFIVLDGKQRLLSILQFWGLGEGSRNGYALSGLDVRKDLVRKRLADFESDPSLEEDFNVLLNQPIRTVVIKNWKDVDFLHLVFLRLNTGSVRLSPQELRQALFPGPFSEWIDDAACSSDAIKRLLKLQEPDRRMRDVEVLSRYLAFRFLHDEYRGRMKEFLDLAFAKFNEEWSVRERGLKKAVRDFEDAVSVLSDVFQQNVGRKPGSPYFNRAVFDVLVFYAQDASTRKAMARHADEVRRVFKDLFKDPKFRSATERDTAGVPSTVERFSRWGEALTKITGVKVSVPTAEKHGVEARIVFRK